ncbi:cell envelope integrity protein TolA [Actinomycetospora aeridis]|uniref:Uncharacterized protein n=1 Tax=Actinomycetospora aeridis TaxID=3129231 RepID=A0ABU8NC27_9PSEU
MGVGTRWWRRTDAEIALDEAWGGPDEVTLAPAPRASLDDTGRGTRELAEREAREQAEREAREQAEREAREQAEREAREQAEREAREQAEREAREQAEREAREQAEREAREQAEREAREQAEREAREQAEREAREQAEREAREQAEREAREQAEREAREQAEREAREQAEREAREQAEREAREQAEREAREQAERDARDKAERDARDKAEREARVQEAREKAEQDRVSTLPGEAVSPSVARDAAAREEAARAAAKANRKRRRRRVLMIFLVAILAVAAVWIVPRLIAMALAVITALGLGPAPDTTTSAPETPVAAASAPGPAAAPAAVTPQELPRGGTTIAPDQRVVVVRATPGVPAEQTADLAETTATSFGSTGRSALPALELPVGDPAGAGAAWQQLAVTRAHRQLLVLAVPAGTADVLGTLAPWERLLQEPDVGLALDATSPLPPEELGAVTGWLATMVRSGNLPQKLLVVPGAAAGAPAEIALVSTGDAASPVLRGVVLPPGGPSAREILAADPAPDVVLYR